MNTITWQRAVIKVGSALVSPDGHGCSTKYLAAIAEFIEHSRKSGKEIILVSSGSVAAARNAIATKHRPTIAEKQAMASVGQMKMMGTWASLISGDCAQILVTVEDLAERKRFVNVKNTIEQLLSNGILPIINENDTVAVEEIKVGDNDNLAAHSAIAVQADCLIICTDVDGLYTDNPRLNPQAELITNVKTIDKKILSLAGGAGTAVGTGGMITKLEAAQKCTQSGIQTLLVNGKSAESFHALAASQSPGTLFEPIQQNQRARHHWLTHTSQVKGRLLVDKGAFEALTKRGASLLAAGITKVGGHFNANESVELIFEDEVIGKGLVHYSSTELNRIIGCKSGQIDAILGYTAGEEAVHRSNLVITFDHQ